jgi:hypothetical protein
MTQQKMFGFVLGIHDSFLLLLLLNLSPKGLGFSKETHGSSAIRKIFEKCRKCDKCRLLAGPQIVLCYTIFDANLIFGIFKEYPPPL